MRVLVGCEFSGVVRDAFRKRGHDAWSCDLLPAWPSSDFHITGDVLDHVADGWDLMIAHPPCTWLCAAMRTNAARKDRPKISSAYIEERDKAYSFVMALASAPIPRIAIENPVGYLNEKWNNPRQLIHPYDFGHDVRKDTCLWLINLPPLMLGKKVVGPHRKVDYWSDKRNPGGYSLKSITYSGIAEAMAEQWGKQEESDV